MSTVAVIDSGINKKHAKNTLNIIKSLSLYIDKNNNISEKEDSKCNNLHGTAVADIITNINPNVQIIDINILDDNLETNGYILLKSIERAIELKPDVINLSLGTNSLKYTIQMIRLIKKATKNNIHVVAAYDNSGRITFPAIIKGVIGVKSISVLKEDNYSNQYAYIGTTYYAPRCSIYAYSLDGSECEKIMYGNSMASAYITGKISLIIDENMDISYKAAINKMKLNF